MSYNYSTKDISELTGLPYRFVLDCVKESQDIFNQVSTRGEKNSLLFDSNGLKMFEHVKTLKDKRMGIKAISESLKSIYINNDKQMKTDIQTSENKFQTEEQTGVTKELLKQLNEANSKALGALEQTIQSKEKMIKLLENQMLLLTDGRSPDEVQAEKITLLKENDELKRQKSDYEAQLASQVESRNKRDSILKKLKDIDGHWFKGKERKQLYEELQALA